MSTAFIVLTTGTAATEHELLQFCRQHLQAHQVPTSIVFVDNLPRNSVGKLLRHELGEPSPRT